MYRRYIPTDKVLSRELKRMFRRYCKEMGGKSVSLKVYAMGALGLTKVKGEWRYI